MITDDVQNAYNYYLSALKVLKSDIPEEAKIGIIFKDNYSDFICLDSQLSFWFSEYVDENLFVQLDEIIVVYEALTESYSNLIQSLAQYL